MTDLDSTEILSVDESLTTENPSIIDIKASLKVLSGTDADTFEINKETIIGRSTPSDFVIAAPSLSKQHAKITINNGQYFITDLGSSNKTFQNKIQLQPNVCYALHDGDEIKLGDVVCSYQEKKQSKVVINLTTGMFTSSYDEEKPTESIKARNSESNGLSDVPPKQNGINESPNKSPHPQTNDDDENNPIVGSATVPGVTESKELNTDDQLEAVPSPQTKKSIFNETSTLSKDMDTDQATESPPMVIDDQETGNTDEMDDEVAPTSTTDKSLRISEKAEDELDAEETGQSTTVSTRGVARRNVRRARGRRGAAARARVISTRLHGGRRQPILPPTTNNEENNTTLEETVNTETEESPKKATLTPEVKEKKSKKNETITPSQESSQINTGSNVRVSARIKERVSTGRNRQFPYTDDYVDLDNLEKQSKINPTAATARKSNRGRPSASPEKRISLRQQPIDASENLEQKDITDVYEQMDTVTENKEPTPKTAGRKRKSTTPVSTVDTKRSRPTTPQTVPTVNTRRKQTSTIEQSPTVAKPSRRTIVTQHQPATTVTTPKRGRKPTKLTTPTEQSPEKQSSSTDRPVRIALSSHLNFDPNHIETLRKLGFEIMDESCQVDALVVDRIRRTKKFFMCLARGAHILSPSWIEAMIKENRYIPYDKYYLEDTNAETRYGFQLRESVQLAKQGRIFENYKFFCTKDTAPPYDDLKDIIEAAGGKLIDKINLTKPGKDIICIVGQIHKNEYEDLFKKGTPIVSEEFILSGISKQKLDFDSFSLFQNSTTIKPNIAK